MGSIDNLPIAHVLYAFDKEDGTVVLLEHNSTMHTGDEIIDYLANLIQCKDNYVRFDLRPEVYDPNNTNTQ